MKRHRTIAHRRLRPRRRRGASFIELLAVLPAVGLITGVVGGTLVLVTRSADRPADDRVRAFEASKAARRIASDLAGALAFSELTATVVDFRVPDRTGNSREDMIRYSWSGTPGDPLLFTLNQESAVAILDDVRALTFTPEIATDVLDPLDEELAVIAHHNQAPDGHNHDHAIEASKWCAQYFEPDLPPGTTSWTIKRVRIMAKRDGADVDGVLGVRIETATLGEKPTGIALEEARVPETTLDQEIGWVDVDFTSLNDLDPLEVYCLVISHVSGTGKAAKVTYEHGGDPMTSGTHWLESDNAGGSWSSIVNDKDMRFTVLGTYDAWVPTARQYVIGVRLRVQAGPSPEAAVELLATVVGPVEADP